MKKLALFTIIVLIFGTISPSLVNHAYGQSDPSILLRISLQADKQIVNQLDKVYGDQIPNNIKILYDKGHLAVKSLDESLPDDVEKAKKDFLLAMNSFMQISRVISQSSDVVPDKSNRNIFSEIDRLEKYAQSLEKVSKKYNVNVKSDFLKIDNLIQKIRTQGNDENLNYNEITNEIKLILDSITKKIRESAAQHRTEFIKQFFDKLLDIIDQTLIQAENDGSDQSQIQLGHELVTETKEFLSKNQIQNAKISYSELKQLLHNMGYSVQFR